MYAWHDRMPKMYQTFITKSYRSVIGPNMISRSSSSNLSLSDLQLHPSEQIHEVLMKSLSEFIFLLNVGFSIDISIPQNLKKIINNQSSFVTKFYHH